MPHLGHVIGDVTTDAATVDAAVGVYVIGVMVEAVATVVVVEVVCTACINLLTSIMVLDVIVSVHPVRDIDPDEPTNILFFLAVEWTQ